MMRLSSEEAVQSSPRDGPDVRGLFGVTRLPSELAEKLSFRL
jgi:hypothetical protein